MVGEVLSREEREKILRALEVDREFRYALMGLLGFKEILERITRLEERFARLEERQLRLEEEFKKLGERFARLEERFAKLEERFAKLEERVARLEEGYLELRKQLARLDERVTRLEESHLELRRAFGRLERTVAVIAHRFGVLSEEAFRQAMRYVVEEALGAGVVERWVYRDEEGFVYGHPAVVEVDVVVREGEHLLVEVKSRVGRGDVVEAARIAALYERVRGVRAQPVIVGGFLDRGVLELAERLGVKIIPVVEESESDLGAL